MANTQYFNPHLLYLFHLSYLSDMRFCTGGRGELSYTGTLETGSEILSTRVSAGTGGEDGILASGEGGVGDSEDKFVTGLGSRRRHCWGRHLSRFALDSKSG